jgi:hypothetical protein
MQASFEVRFTIFIFIASGVLANKPSIFSLKSGGQRNGSEYVIEDISKFQKLVINKEGKVVVKLGNPIKGGLGEYLAVSVSEVLKNNAVFVHAVVYNVPKAMLASSWLDLGEKFEFGSYKTVWFRECSNTKERLSQIDKRYLKLDHFRNEKKQFDQKKCDTLTENSQVLFASRDSASQFKVEHKSPRQIDFHFYFYNEMTSGPIFESTGVFDTGIWAKIQSWAVGSVEESSGFKVTLTGSERVKLI